MLSQFSYKNVPLAFLDSRKIYHIDLDVCRDINLFLIRLNYNIKLISAEREGGIEGCYQYRCVSEDTLLY